MQGKNAQDCIILHFAQYSRRLYSDEFNQYGGDLLGTQLLSSQNSHSFIFMPNQK
jgi:hypothetical protein